MNNLTVFINKVALQQEGQEITEIQNAAKKMNYHIEFVEQNKG